VTQQNTEQQKHACRGGTEQVNSRQEGGKKPAREHNIRNRENLNEVGGYG
jgi:hypothetical protein